MYIEESMWILLGVLIGLVAAWFVIKNQNLLKVGWAVVTLDNEVLWISVDRQQAYSMAKNHPRASRCTPVFMKVYGPEQPPS